MSVHKDSQVLVQQPQEFASDTPEMTRSNIEQQIAHHIMTAKSKSGEDALRYFQALWKRGIGQRSAKLYIAWAELERDIHGMENAVEVVQKGLQAGAEPRQAMDILLDSLLHHSKGRSRQRVLEADSAHVPPLNTDSIADQEHSKSSTPFARIPKASTASSLGRSQRLRENQLHLQSDQLPITPAVTRTPAASYPTEDLLSHVNASAEEIKRKKVNLSKYLDDTLKNFDPLARSQKPAMSPIIPAFHENLSHNKDILNNENNENRGTPSGSRLVYDHGENNENAVVAGRLPYESFSSKKRRPFAVLDTTTNQTGSDDGQQLISEARGIAIQLNVEPVSEAVTRPIESDVPLKKESTRPPQELQAEPAAKRKRVSFDPLDDAPRQRSRVFFNESSGLAPAGHSECPVVLPNESRKISDSDTHNTLINDNHSSSSSSRSIIINGNGDGNNSNNNNSSSTSSSSIQHQDHNFAQHSHSNSTSTHSNTPALSGFQSKPTIRVNGKDYFQLALLGKGGSSSVRRVISAEDGSVLALKRVDIKDNDDAESVLASYANEIDLLKRLKGTSPHIIELVDWEVDREAFCVKMLLEPGDVDLAKLLQQRQRTVSGLDPIFARLVWKEMLLAVHHIHEHRIVHGDLKPANFVFVRGHLKLIDFGIAKSFTSDTTNIVRDSHVGTVNYMAPESIAPSAENISVNPDSNQVSMKLGRASDIWSLGCILYQMLFGRPPFAALNTVQKLHAIPNPNVDIQYPEHEDVDAVQSVRMCLVRNPKLRASITGPTGLLSARYLAIPSTCSNPLPAREGESAINAAVTAKASISTATMETMTSPQSSSAGIPSEQQVQSCLQALKQMAMLSGDRSFAVKDFLDGVDCHRLIEHMSGKSLPRAPAPIIHSNNVPLSAIRPRFQLRTESGDKENHLDRDLGASTLLSRPSPLVISARKFTGNRDSLRSLKPRSPLKAVSLNWHEPATKTAEETDSVVKAQPNGGPEDGETVKTSLEKRRDKMRQFLCDDHENHTATESIDMSFTLNSCI